MTAPIAAANLDAMVRAAVTDAGGGPAAAGALVGVVRDGAVVASSAHGLASVEHGVPIDDECVFDIASVSKQMTSAVALLLQRDGALDLDVDTRELVPELDVGTQISLRQCLQHTAGLSDYLTRHELAGGFLGELSGEDGFLRAVGEMSGLERPPGAGIFYSNTGYVLAALAMRRATGKALPGLMSERLFVPLGMTRSRLRDEHGLVLPGLAFSYTPDDERMLRHEMPLVQYGDGAVLTTLGDLARWQAFLADGRVLGADLRDQLVTAGSLADGTAIRYAYGLMCADTAAGRVVEHSGGMYGYRSYLASFDDRGSGNGYGVVVLSNLGTLVPRRLAWSVLREVVDLPRPAQAAPPADLAGSWFAPEAPEVLEVRLTPDGGGGVLEMGGQLHQLGEVRTEDGGHWVDDTGWVQISCHEDGLLLTDRLGQRTRFVRPAPSDEAPPLGTWTGRSARTTLTFVPDGQDVLVAARRSDPARYRRVGRHDGRTIWTSDAGCLLVEESSSGRSRRVRLTLDGTSMEYDEPLVGIAETAPM